MTDSTGLTPEDKAVLRKLVPAIDDAAVRAKVEALIATSDEPETLTRGVSDSAPATDHVGRGFHHGVHITDNAGLTDTVAITVNGIALSDPEVGHLRRIVDLGMEVTSRGEQISEAANNMASFTQWLADRVPPEVWDAITKWPGG